MDETMKDDLGIMAAFAVVFGAFALAAFWSWHVQAAGAIPVTCDPGNADIACRTAGPFPAAHPFFSTILVMIATGGLVRLGIFMHRMEQFRSR